MTKFNIFSYATIASAEYKVFDNKALHDQKTVSRPTTAVPRPCFGFIWSNLNQYIRTEKRYMVNYSTEIFINRNPQWALDNAKKNYCALSDDEIDIYLKFVSEVAGEKFTISYKEFSEGNFNGIVVSLKADEEHFKHVMIVCNLIRYMYEWPEAYNLKQMLIAYKNKMFYEDFGQIFCLYESYMRNQCDQHISCVNELCDRPSYIPIYTTAQLHDKLVNHDIKKEACCYLNFAEFSPNIVNQLRNNRDMWVNNKSTDYLSDNYVNKSDSVDDKLVNNITSLYKYIILNESF